MAPASKGALLNIHYYYYYYAQTGIRTRVVVICGPARYR